MTNWLPLTRAVQSGELNYIVVIEEPVVSKKILKYPGLDPQLPPSAPARKYADLLEWA